MKTNRDSVFTQSVRKRASMIVETVVKSATMLSVAYNALSVRETEAISCLSEPHHVEEEAALNTLSPLGGIMKRIQPLKDVM